MNDWSTWGYVHPDAAFPARLRWCVAHRRTGEIRQMNMGPQEAAELRDLLNGGLLRNEPLIHAVATHILQRIAHQALETQKAALVKALGMTEALIEAAERAAAVRARAEVEANEEAAAKRAEIEVNEEAAAIEKDIDDWGSRDT